MEEWIRGNITTIIGFTVTFGGGAWALIKVYFTFTAQVQKNTELIVEAMEMSKETNKRLEEHVADTSKHANGVAITNLDKKFDEKFEKFEERIDRKFTEQDHKFDTFSGRLFDVLSKSK